MLMSSRNMHRWWVSSKNGYLRLLSATSKCFFKLLFNTGPIPVMNLVIGLVCPSIQTHISVTAGRNFLIWSMVMGYDLGMMPIVSQTHRQKCPFLKNVPML